MRQRIPPRHRNFARVMRADATKAENLLWQALRNKQFEGLKFKGRCRCAMLSVR